MPSRPLPPERGSAALYEEGSNYYHSSQFGGWVQCDGQLTGSTLYQAIQRERLCLRRSDEPDRYEPGRRSHYTPHGTTLAVCRRTRRAIWKDLSPQVRADHDRRAARHRRDERAVVDCRE